MRQCCQCKPKFCECVNSFLSYVTSAHYRLFSATKRVHNGKLKTRIVCRWQTRNPRDALHHGKRPERRHNFVYRNTVSNNCKIPIGLTFTQEFLNLVVEHSRLFIASSVAGPQYKMLAAPMSFVITSVIIETHASALSSYCAPQQVTPLSSRPVEVEALWGGRDKGGSRCSERWNRRSTTHVTRALRRQKPPPFNCSLQTRLHYQTVDTHAETDETISWLPNEWGSFRVKGAGNCDHKLAHSNCWNIDPLRPNSTTLSS